MNNRVKLLHTNNEKMKAFEGEQGYITPNEKGGYNFAMDNGKTISTSQTKPNTTLGDLNHPACKSFSFETQSGTVYDFEANLEREKLVDGCFMKDNQFLGFEENEIEELEL